jgi:hypothetical protein
LSAAWSPREARRVTDSSPDSSPDTAGAADPATLLAAYDEQLREELSSALTAPRLGPLVLATYLGGRGFVTYKNLDVDGQPADEGSVRGLVEETLAHYRAMPDIVRVEWKTRGHDHAPGLHEALVDNGFRPDEPESVMIGEARLLAYDVELPEGVVVREVTHDDDAVRRMLAMQATVFDDSPEFAAEMEAQIFHRLRTRDDLEMWVAEADGEVVSAGRLEPVEGTEFAGVWGATLPTWRGRGIYRALTSARARSAIAHGKKYVHSDSTEFSRPILERSGLVTVTTTTPYQWRRDRAS